MKKDRFGNKQPDNYFELEQIGNLATREDKIEARALSELMNNSRSEYERPGYCLDHEDVETRRRELTEGTLKEADTAIEKEKGRADQAVQMHDQLAKEIKPSVEEGFESLADKVALKITGPGKKKRTDKSLSDRRLEQKIYSHYKSIYPTMRRKKFAEEFYGDYGLTKEEMFLLLERVRKRLERGTK